MKSEIAELREALSKRDAGTEPSSTSTSQEAAGPTMTVPRYATEAIIVAIEREIDSQLNASGMAVGDMQRQDGSDVWEAAIGAVERGGNSGAAPGDALDAGRWNFFCEHAQSFIDGHKLAEWLMFDGVMVHGSRNAAIDAAIAASTSKETG